MLSVQIRVVTRTEMFGLSPKVSHLAAPRGLRFNIDVARPPAGTTPGRFMNESNESSTRTQLVGWGFVVAQFVLIAALILTGQDDHWPIPGWLRLVSWALFVGGFVIMAAAALRLGWSLTPTPVPRTVGQLKTDGLYRWARHPIYSGLLVVVVAITLRSASLVTAAIAVAIIIFFNAKAAWEEGRLKDRYLGYAAYAARTPRFIPSIRSLVDRSG